MPANFPTGLSYFKEKQTNDLVSICYLVYGLHTLNDITRTKRKCFTFIYFKRFGFLKSGSVLTFPFLKSN
jgi:hypothetical protein